MNDMTERVLDKDQWDLEAQAIINDVKNHVQNISLSSKLQSSNKLIYLNLTTLEGLQFCIELSGAGFSIVGNQYDDTSNNGNESFETPYSLLNFVSPHYKDSFSKELSDKLHNLSNSQ